VEGDQGRGDKAREDEQGDAQGLSEQQEICCQRQQQNDADPGG
jgi:hypothetical protein